jgi:hypothetical protein
MVSNKRELVTAIETKVHSCFSSPQRLGFVAVKVVIVQVVPNSTHSCTISVSFHQNVRGGPPCSGPAIIKSPQVCFHTSCATFAPMATSVLCPADMFAAGRRSRRSEMSSPVKPAALAHLGMSMQGREHLNSVSSISRRCVSSHSDSPGPADSRSGTASMSLNFIVPPGRRTRKQSCSNVGICAAGRRTEGRLRWIWSIEEST